MRAKRRYNCGVVTAAGQAMNIVPCVSYTI